MADPTARSPVSPPRPAVVAGWEVSGLRSAAHLTLTDVTPLVKIGVRAAPDGPMSQALGVPFGRAARGNSGVLVIGTGPGEWLVLAPAGQTAWPRDRLTELAARYAGGELVTVLDLTHGSALLRLTGIRSAAVLSKVCGVDLADAATPNGAAFRSHVAGLVTEVARDDTLHETHLVPSYLLQCERSYGQYLFDALLDAGDEFAIEVDGFRPPGI